MTCVFVDKHRKLKVTINEFFKIGGYLPPSLVQRDCESEVKVAAEARGRATNEARMRGGASGAPQPFLCVAAQPPP